MGNGYTRQSETDIQATNVVKAKSFNDEFDELLAAFVASTGHTHDGTAAEGGPIIAMRDADGDTKIQVEESADEDKIRFDIAGTEQLTIEDGGIIPTTDSDIDLGTASKEFKDLYLDGIAHIDTLDVDVNATVAGTLGVTGAVTLSSILSIPDGSASNPSITNTGDTNCGLFFSASDEIAFTAGGVAQVIFADGSITPQTDNDIDLGASDYEFKDGYFDGTVHTDAINLNGTTITSTAAELNILDGVTATATELNILDGSATSATSTTVADADRVVMNDNGTMVQVAVTDLAAYFDDEITAMPNLTSVGTLTTLTVDNVIVNGTTIGHTDDTDLITLADGVVTVAGVVSLPDGSASAPSITNTGDTNQGLFFSGTDTMAFTAGGTAQFTMADGAIAPVTDSDVDLGTSSLYFKDAYIDTVTTTGNVTIGGNLTVTGTQTVVDTVTMNAANAIVFEGATADDHETTLTITDPTADRTIKLPNQSGTLPVLAADSNTAITSTPAELNLLDGVTATTAELNILDGVTSTAAELNIVDGDTSASTVTLVDADRVVINDGGTMKQVALTTLNTYIGGSTTGVGALNSGSITSGFGSIDNGSSAITTTGTITYGSLSDGTITITAFVDEDGMDSNSATLVPTQQSVKAYVDANRNVTGLNATGAEINVVADGDTSVGTTAVAGGDGIPTNDSGTMRLTSVDTFDTYLAGTTKTLTNKTLTAPKFADGGFIADANGNEILSFQTASSATNYLEITNAANSGAVVIGVEGSSDSNIDIDITPKGTGEVNIAAGNLNYAGTAVTATGAELNLTDGSSGGTIVNSKAVIYGSSGEVNATTLQIAGAAITSTAAELNIVDGNTSATGGTLVDADRIVVNDNGTMVQETLATLKTYLTPLIQEEATALAIALG